MRQYDLCVFIGRMQPPSKAHIATITAAKNIATNVLVVLGSAYQARTIKNPFSYEDRVKMLSSIFGNNYGLSYVGVSDNLYNNTSWASAVQNAVDNKIADITGNNIEKIRKFKVCIIGCKKDHSSFYLEMFPQWEFVEMDMIPDINATDIRDAYFSGGDYNSLLESGVVGCFMNDFKKTDEYARLVREYDHIKAYKKSWEAAPYPPTFVTADAVVEQSGHILMVVRGAAPGEGLLALPGGFVNQYETLIDAAVRELREETKLKVPEPVLRGSVEWSETFDNPYRSLRGRTITTAFLIRLPAGPLPKVKGGDDARYARWIPINELLGMKEQIFEDHESIIRRMLGV